MYVGSWVHSNGCGLCLWWSGGWLWSSIQGFRGHSCRRVLSCPALFTLGTDNSLGFSLQFSGLAPVQVVLPGVLIRERREEFDMACELLQ